MNLQNVNADELSAKINAALKIVLNSLKETKIDGDTFATYKNEQMTALQDIYNQIASIDDSTINNSDELAVKLNMITASMDSFNTTYQI